VFSGCIKVTQFGFSPLDYYVPTGRRRTTDGQEMASDNKGSSRTRHNGLTCVAMN